MIVLLITFFSLQALIVVVYKTPLEEKLLREYPYDELELIYLTLSNWLY
jgi:hypothetical protein